MSLQVYNTMTHKKEPFVPLEPGKVKIYVCGPTVYGLLHVGNFRGPVFYNVVRNWLEKSGFEVAIALNFTDVDDRIIQKANAEGVTATDISERYITEYRNDYGALGLRPHTHNPKVTDVMDEIVAMIATLVDNNKAYVADGEVLYSVRSFDGYGKLSNRNLDDLQAGARVEVDPKKRDPMDFALWKPAKPGEPHWASPWSNGRPGWHIECSAMIKKLFGDSIDIHGGGTDLVFPHHENEIAQSEGASGKPFVKYWMHNNMLTLGQQKMSKSIGNIRTAKEFLAQYNAEIYKYMILSAHYRSLLAFNDDAVEHAISGLARVYSALNLADRLLESGSGVAPGPQPAKAMGEAIKASDAAFAAALNDDFNTPEAFAAIFGVVRAFNGCVRLGQKATPDVIATATAFRDWMRAQGALLSLFQEKPAEYLRLLDDMLLTQKGLERAKIDALVAERAEVRAAKDFKRSDELRDALLKMGIAVQDTAAGSSWEVAK